MSMASHLHEDAVLDVGEFGRRVAAVFAARIEIAAEANEEGPAQGEHEKEDVVGRSLPGDSHTADQCAEKSQLNDHAWNSEIIHLFGSFTNAITALDEGHKSECDEQLNGQNAVDLFDKATAIVLRG